jgi:hypothetical protein
MRACERGVGGSKHHSASQGCAGDLQVLSSVQGSTDMALLYETLPGYLAMSSDKDVDFETCAKRFSKTSYWANGRALCKSIRLVTVPRGSVAVHRQCGGSPAGDPHQFPHAPELVRRRRSHRRS